MSDYLNDPETQKHFADIRAANARKLQLEQEQRERQRQQADEDAKRHAEERRRQAAERLESDLRAAFFTANPAATSDDYERLAPRLRDQHMLNAASQASTNVFDRARSEAERRRQEARDRQDRFNRLPQGA